MSYSWNKNKWPQQRPGYYAERKEKKEMEETQNAQTPAMTEATGGVSYEMLQILLKAQQESSMQMAQEMAKTIVQELRKPTPEEQVRLDEEAAHRERRKAEMIELARIEGERQIKSHGEHCKKPNGQFPLGGQTFSDGRHRRLCLRCQTWVEDRKVEQSELAGGDGNITEPFMPQFA